MLTLEKAYEYVSVMEGEKLWAYFDTKGWVTIGVGCNMDAPGAKKLFDDLAIPYTKVYNKTIPITKEQSMKLFKVTFDVRMKELPKLIPTFNQLSDNRQLALFDVSMAGMKTLSGFHNMLTAVNIGDWNAAAYHLLDSHWAKDVKDHRAIPDSNLLRNG